MELAIFREAEISPCGRYRYSLSRSWGEGRGWVNFVMLNPSTADANLDDPTIRRCIAFARGWGFSGLVVTNLYAWRATDPKELNGVKDPFGPCWADRVYKAAYDSEMIIFAWGVHGAKAAPARLYPILEGFMGKVCHLGKTKEGHPKHPLYLKKSTIPILWKEPTHV